MVDTQRPIGIFDSGVGGLTVFKEIRRTLPGEDIIYLGDTARVPYGIRSPETVLKYATANTNFLLRQQVKLLVIACNTASAVAAGTLSRTYAMPVVDVVAPGAQRAVQVTKNRRVGVIGTDATIRSGAYEQALMHIDSGISVHTRACPLFVPLVEEGWCAADDQIVALTVRRYLAGMKETGIDTLVLGCTHYPILKDAIQQELGPEITLVDSAEETARATAALLAKSGLRRGNVSGSDTFFVTDTPDRFIEAGSRFLGMRLQNVHLIDIM